MLSFSLPTRSRRPHFRWAILLALTCLALPAYGAQVTIFPDSGTEASAQVSFSTMGSPMDDRLYADVDDITSAPVSLPAGLNATATSALALAGLAIGSNTKGVRPRRFASAGSRASAEASAVSA